MENNTFCFIIITGMSPLGVALVAFETATHNSGSVKINLVFEFATCF